MTNRKLKLRFASSFLGRAKKLKKKNESLVIGVGGCVAQQEGDNILKREPIVDLVFGTDAYLKC